MGVMNGHTVMKWRHQGGWREDGVWRTSRPHAAATRRIAQRPGAVKGEITHLLCLFLTATAPIYHYWGRDRTCRPISSMNYGTEKHLPAQHHPAQLEAGDATTKPGTPSLVPVDPKLDPPSHSHPCKSTYGHRGKGSRASAHLNVFFPSF